MCWGVVFTISPSRHASGGSQATPSTGQHPLYTPARLCGCAPTAPCSAPATRSSHHRHRHQPPHHAFTS